MNALMTVALAGLGALLVAAPAQAAFPGANGRIAYVDSWITDPEGGPPIPTGEEIWTANPDDTGHLRLTTNDPSISDTEPTWSPDGQRIAFASNRNGAFQLYVMRPDGRHQQRLTWGAEARTPAWSPDGRWLVFAREGDLWLTRSAGGRPWRLTSTPGVVESVPAWSPRGYEIAYAATAAGGVSQIWTIRPNGHHARNLSLRSGGGAIADTDPDFSPNGRRIVFVSRRGQPDASPSWGESLWTMRADGRTPILLAPASQFIGQNTPVYSPDGTRVALRSCGFGICPLFTQSSGAPTTRPAC